MKVRGACHLGWVVAFEFQTVVSSTSVGRRASPDIRGHDSWNHMSPESTMEKSLLLFCITSDKHDLLSHRS
jgi:hypothetical protein